MTPQLQQAIRLLQLSSLELQTEIQEALETNPLLEVEEDYDYDEPGPARRDEHSDSREISELENRDIPEDLPVDSKWEDTYDNTQNISSSGATSDSDFERDNHDESSDTLQQHLLWQMRLTPFTETEQAIATMIIDSIEDDGYLKTSLEDIQQSLGEEFADVELDEIETVLHRIHHFDPVGVGARDLRECLLIQLRLYESTVALKHVELLTELIDKHLDTLAKRDYAQIKRALKVSDEELTELVRSIQLLNPRPGSSIQTDKTEYIVPDVYAVKKNGQWRLSLNPDNAPQTANSGTLCFVNQPGRQ